MKADLEQRLRDAAHSLPELPASSFSGDIAELIGDAIRSGARVILGDTATKNGVTSVTVPTVLSDARPEMNLLRSDLLAPVMSLVPVTSMDEALRFDRICPYALGATVFGDDQEALRIARRIDTGCVVVNDMIAPTADPRVPFGGRRLSGFGVTRGLAGLEEMTQTKAIIHQRGNWLPHLDDTTPFDAKLLSGYLGMTHGRDWRRRLRSAWSAVQAAMDQRRWRNTQHERRPDDVQ
jgi:aldehyde dehydrogenase (NAD+)